MISCLRMISCPRKLNKCKSLYLIFLALSWASYLWLSYFLLRSAVISGYEVNHSSFPRGSHQLAICSSFSNSRIFLSIHPCIMWQSYPSYVFYIVLFLLWVSLKIKHSEICWENLWNPMWPEECFLWTQHSSLWNRAAICSLRKVLPYPCRKQSQEINSLMLKWLNSRKYPFPEIWS